MTKLKYKVGDEFIVPFSANSHKKPELTYYRIDFIHYDEYVMVQSDGKYWYSSDGHLDSGFKLTKCKKQTVELLYE